METLLRAGLPLTYAPTGIQSHPYNAPLFSMLS